MITLMTRFFYSISISVFDGLIAFASLFNEKVRFIRKGRGETFEKLKSFQKNNQKVVWVHCASLGEFEQGRPVIEAIKEREPQTKIVLTFFSPSGYEIRKNYAGADVICYLPADKPKNVKRFLDAVQPDVALFVKYEFWYFFLTELKKRAVKTYIFSAIFRSSQPFFKGHGEFHRQMLQCFDHIFVQNQESVHLLHEIGFDNVTAAVDTRFDRVAQIVVGKKAIPVIEKFTHNHPTLVIGSSWLPDEQLLAQFINQTDKNYRFIIAPHEIDASHIQKIEALLNVPFVKYSTVTDFIADDIQVVIIDSIGLLSSLYQYGNVAYIGGGFGKGIHNTLEAATYSIPVVFGPKYQKFKEACDLIELGGAISIQEYKELNKWMTLFLSDGNYAETKGIIAGGYVSTQTGATAKIVTQIL